MVCPGSNTFHPPPSSRKQNLLYFVVAIGRMTDVTPTTVHTKLDLSLDFIKQGSMEYFTKDYNKNTKVYKGQIFAPSKCGMQYGPGKFVFMAKVQFGKAHLRCAPTYNDFHNLQRTSKLKGAALCTWWICIVYLHKLLVTVQKMPPSNREKPPSTQQDESLKSYYFDTSFASQAIIWQRKPRLIMMINYPPKLWCGLEKINLRSIEPPPICFSKLIGWTDSCS